MRSLVFEGQTWQAYEQLRQKDKRLHRSLCRVLNEMLRGDPTQGLGKPEALKHNLSGMWSRRLSKRDRLIYSFDDKHIYIFAIGGHWTIRCFLSFQCFLRQLKDMRQMTLSLKN